MKLWKNGLIYSMNNNNDIYHSVITKDNIIIDVNSNDLTKYDIREDIDLKGNFMFPGFTDSHIHLVGYGKSLLANRFDSFKTKVEVLKEVKLLNNINKVFIEGYYDVGITKYDLDHISSKNYIILRHNDYHSYTVNSKVLNELSITSDTGIIKDSVNDEKISKLFLSYSKEELVNFTIAGIDKLHSYGITEVHTEDLSYFNSYDETLDILHEASNKSSVKLNTLIHYDVYNEYLEKGIRYKNINPIGVKLFYDGTLSSATALLKSNYVGKNHNGMRISTIDEFTKIVEEIKSNNDLAAIHVIGDQGLSEVVDILAKYQTNKKDRIIHASLSSLDDIERLSKLNVSIDIQPQFVKSDSELINQIVSHDLLVYPFKEYINNNIIINSSSDAPVEDPNPLEAIYYLSNISRLDAIKSYTTNPHYTIGSNNGIIDIGKIADFTIFNKDILKVSKEELLSTNVYMTVVDGRIVYIKEE